MSFQVQKHYFNVNEYHRMAEVGLLSEDSRVELIEGEIIEMSPIGSTHGGTVKRSSTFLKRKLGDAVTACRTLFDSMTSRSPNRTSRCSSRARTFTPTRSRRLRMS